VVPKLDWDGARPFNGIIERSFGRLERFELFERVERFDLLVHQK